MDFDCGPYFNADELTRSAPGQPDQGWEEPLNFSGDFYAPVDEVTRGVSMPTGPPNTALLEDLEPYGSGSDEKSRGIFVDFDAPESCYHDALGDAFEVPPCFDILPSSFDQPHELRGKEAGRTTRTSQPTTCQSPVLRRFTETDRPPVMPEDPLFQLNNTTLRIHSNASFQVGNLVLDFLTNKLKSQIKKVNPQKFSVKAEIFVDGASCVLKIRTYEVKCETFLVEFQRRSGDCVAFGKAFQLAAEHLTPHFLASSGAADLAKTPKLPRCKHDTTDAEGIEPLLDIATAEDREHLALEEEAAAAFSELAHDSQEVPSLCNSRAFDGFKKLLCSSQENVAYPTACTLSALAQWPEAAPYFANQGILPIVAEKIRSVKTSDLVQQELAQALNKTLAVCATTLSEKVSEEIMESLSDATKSLRISNALTYQQVQEAYSALKYRYAGAPGTLPGKAAVVQCGGTDEAPGIPKTASQRPTTSVVPESSCT
mmetsp:Transcript_86819/g.202048  ORF Transcript_86819/g.202048 Transcript_86819/m.202048 type:complete len:485 (+) Transcript_86819:197-1651(+)|eukprot:CAMPEP_0171096756 /NCGR_PEP_ID=MMETSP0766_2-20121228/45820_1 /TAXON_ID=439317 /ORGANISM="Gambierdiscus australes, Strain CAWD 149" /LENGTH=484 /DNA_ID=CAMNT_0011555809 /DNA_START=178 /DNA_END=1632 /DNA_ORIENTATION=+